MEEEAAAVAVATASKNEKRSVDRAVALEKMFRQDGRCADLYFVSKADPCTTTRMPVAF